MNRYRVVVSYDGTNYAGWQVQPEHRTVQATVEDAIKSLTGEHVRVYGSSRTDQGVHALAQNVHFDMRHTRKIRRLRVGLNALLPPDIRALSIKRVDPRFDARRHAKIKEYRYFIWNAPVLPPFLRAYRTHVRKKLDVAAMRKAARCLLGRRDFSSFTANPNREVESTVRRLTALNIRRCGPEIVITARSNGFLYKMARSICGFLIRVGEGAIPASDTPRILRSRLRTALVPTAPPQGLFLWKVTY